VSLTIKEADGEIIEAEALVSSVRIACSSSGRTSLTKCGVAGGRGVGGAERGGGD